VACSSTTSCVALGVRSNASATLFAIRMTGNRWKRIDAPTHQPKSALSLPMIHWGESPLTNRTPTQRILGRGPDRLADLASTAQTNEPASASSPIRSPGDRLLLRPPPTPSSSPAGAVDAGGSSCEFVVAKVSFHDLRSALFCGSRDRRGWRAVHEDVSGQSAADRRIFRARADSCERVCARSSCVLRV
jgi:hypothetical protein